MSLPELHTHTFIIKIWQEEPATGDLSAVWRGNITHVLTGQRRYFESMDGIVTFMNPYLREMGALANTELDNSPDSTR